MNLCLSNSYNTVIRLASNMFEGVKYEDLEMIATLDSTHNDSTIVSLVRYKEDVLVCKVDR